MPSIGTAILDFIGYRMEIFCQLALQTRTIERRKRGYLRWFQTRIKLYDQPRNVGRIENDDHMFHIGTIAAYILTESSGNFGISFQ